MAKRRLNKKVAFVGSAVLVVILLAAIWVVLGLSRDPHEFIEQGDAAVRAKDYKTAAANYTAAYKRAKQDELKEDILLKLVDVSIATGEWDLVIRYWNTLVALNPRNAKARFGRLKYMYIVAQSGGSGSRLWQQVYNEAADFLHIAERAGLLKENISQWDLLVRPGEEPEDHTLEAYLRLLKGRSALEMAVAGAVTDKDQTLKEAQAELEAVKALEPKNIEVYYYLARVAMKGELLPSRGLYEERDDRATQAKTLLEEAVRVAGENPRAHINLLMFKVVLARAAEQPRDEVEALEPDFLDLAKKFPSSPEMHMALAEYYSNLASYSFAEKRGGYLDRAIAAAEKAIEIDPENVDYVIGASNLYRRKFSIYKHVPSLYRSIELAQKGLSLPGAQIEPGPWTYTSKINRFRLCAVLAHNYLGQLLEPIEVRTEAERQKWLADGEQVIREIEQIFESGQDPQVVMWRGMLELAKGKRKSAVKKLYAAYEQIRAVKPAKPPWRMDQQFAYLCYLLGRVFRDTPEVGAVAEFLASALYSGISTLEPEARLDYVETILKLSMWSDAIQNIDVFETRVGSNARSRLLRVAAYIGARDYEKAAALLDQMPQDDPKTLQHKLALVQAQITQNRLTIAARENKQILETVFGELPSPPGGENASESLEVIKKELADYRQLEAQLVNKLLAKDPNAVEATRLVDLCKFYLEQGQVDKATGLVEEFLRHFPQDPGALVLKQVLSEPDPQNVSEERYRQFEEQVLASLADPVQRALQLGIFYRRNGEYSKAVEQLKKVLQLEPPGKRYPKTWYYQAGEEDYPRLLAAAHLFDVAVKSEDWALAEEVRQLAREEDLDECEGQVFAARLAFARNQLDEALRDLDECIRQKPVFSRAYALRSSIHSALGDDHAALEDIRMATAMNPLDGLIAKGLAQLLYRRTKQQGENVTPEQMAETQKALQRAMALNPGDLRLRSFFADFIAPTEPLKALAILQALQKNDPSYENSVRLADLAMRVAREQTDQKRRDFFFRVAGSAIDAAEKTRPNDRYMLHLKTEYLRAIGKDTEAVAVLEQAKEDDLLWNHYYRRGEYEEARKVLERMYAKEPNNTSVVKGLLIVSEKLKDPDAVKRYSEDLISIDPSVDNRLIQIQSYLRIGLVNEASVKLDSFVEKNPDEPRTMLLRAWLLMRKGQLDRALELTERFLEQNPNSAAAWRLRGEIHFYLGDMAKAVNDLKHSKSVSDEPLTRMILAKVYLRTSRYEEALTELKNAMDAPGAPLEVRFLLEETYKRLGRKEALRKFYEELVSEFPNSAFWLNRAGSFALDSGQYEQARELFGKAFELRREAYKGEASKNLRFDELYALAFDGYLRASILSAGRPNTSNWNPQRLDEVFELANKYVETDYAPLAYLRMAQAKLVLGHRKTAVEYCWKSVDEAEDNEALASEVLLRMFLLLGPDEVEKYCREKLKENPNSMTANFTMFIVSKVREDYNAAVEYIQKCIGLLRPDDPRRVDYIVKKAEMLTMAYQRSSDKDLLQMAIADYESLVEKMPNNTSVLNNLAYMLAESNEKLSKALEYAERAYSLVPNDPGILDTYGYVLHRNNKNVQAAGYLAAAIQQYEQKNIDVPPDVYEHLGAVKEALGDKAAALNAYKQAMEVGRGRISEKTKKRINEAIKRLSQ